LGNNQKSLSQVEVTEMGLCEVLITWRFGAQLWKSWSHECGATCPI